MKNPERTKLIVLFPLYNGAKSIRKSLQCIADQTMRDFRAIIVENRSTDNSLAIAQKFCAEDERFSVVQNEVHVGGVENFVNAVAKYENECDYICIRPHDDFSSLDYLEKLVSALDGNPDKVFACCTSHRIQDGVRSVTSHNPKITEFGYHLRAGTAPRWLSFPSDWFYGVYRCGVGTEILRRRFPELGSPWCAASYTVTEFLLRDLAIYVPGPYFEFHYGAGSADLYMEKTILGRLLARLNYSRGTFDVRHRMAPLTLAQTIIVAQISWRNAKKKMGYKIFGV